jgi:lipopolysaccharide/colanic/teichoic acid biosynthesis glycosyltransferase
MYENAEHGGPQLSKDKDSRCTPFGAIMRKWRLDELPQFWNVLIGEMSLVGPRPERKFYIDKIMEKAPHYRHLLKVRPGITSWGQVKYGYASNVDQMIQRLKYDILYLENRSIALDFKIMFYTLVVLVQGTGK